MRLSTLLLLVAAITFISIYSSVYRLKLNIMTCINSTVVTLPFSFQHLNRGPDTRITERAEHQKFTTEHHSSAKAHRRDADERTRQCRGYYKIHSCLGLYDQQVLNSFISSAVI